MSGAIEIVRGYVPGAIGRVAQLHGTYYARHWGFGMFFEAKVASELAAFLGRGDGEGDGFWAALDEEGDVRGSIAIDGAGAAAAGAHLRWFIVDEAHRGRGVGGRLLDEAVGFCREAGHRRVFLWTFRGLEPARRLYEGRGFRIVEERRGAQWGVAVYEQRFELVL